MSVGDDPSRAGYGAPSPKGTAGLLGAARRTARPIADDRGHGWPAQGCVPDFRFSICSFRRSEKVSVV